MTNFFDHLTVEALTARLAMIEAKSQEVMARIASGERSEVVTSKMVKGVWTNVTALEHSRNSLRHAWEQTKRELDARVAA